MGWSPSLPSALAGALSLRVTDPHVDVFSTSQSIRESCFSEICREGAIHLFGFVESVAKSKRYSKKMFRFLDLYDAISNFWPVTKSKRSQVKASSLTSAFNKQTQQIKKSLKQINTRPGVAEESRRYVTL
uniref:Exocyst subunit Exo70 family protein n=1 Tax=Nelumbo nucifera TaxID=4432 RepID=A0A822YU93_NELNU|nr:TPA_asm: hypothetical protein HUJ06_005761 [Nelumbo nucifera]